jgi:FOG: EAL domain
MDNAETGRNENRVRIRMGVYANADKTLDIERRFDRAKIAADTVKGSFTHAVGIYDDSLHEAELLEEQLIEDFPRAIREKQFLVYYQPKFDVRPDTPVLSSAEALVRWNHPSLGMVSPGVFIPLFERNGLIYQLDSYVWAEAAAQIRDWKDRLGILLPVSVNVSRIDLFEPRLTGQLREITERSGLSPRDLLLEITESAYTEDSAQITERVRQLREMNFRIEMDDFGSGYSSLNMLSTLPVDALKLDMQFVRNAFRDRTDTRLLEIMIRLAEAFGLPTIAEGVETAEQVLALREMGCDIIQGYYFSRPLPAPEFECFLLEHRPEASEN